jgi:hypothetical protein
MSRTLSKLCLSALLPLGLAAGITPASASVCMDHKSLTGYLNDKFDEQPKAIGLVEARNLMEVFVSQKGTWTIVMTSTQGVSCIIAAGDTWEDVKLAFVKEQPEY